ncbi:MAG: hypothetical protein GYA55_03060 [SAR324 cluster bacterium]|uniref:Uncharacterized protein n=1 Tax=SAR324 cluster bacterium TaxID=2024889 RepID=A0A7X9FQP9_9DELT|nr:hypothetical protein [SAR324 cluster bacterium]
MASIDYLLADYNNDIPDYYYSSDYDYGYGQRLERTQRFEVQGHEWQCENENYIDSVLAPFFEERLPDRENIRGQLLNHFTGFYDFMGTARQELCDNGRISSLSARKALNMVARSASSAAIGGATLMYSGLGLALGGPVGLAGVLALGGLGLVFGPQLAEWGITKVGNFASDLLSRSGEWIKESMGWP